MSSTGDPSTVPPAVTVVNYVDQAELKRDLAYSLANLSDAMSEQASLFAHYGVQAAKSSHQVDVVKLLLENTEAAVYRLERDRLEGAGEKVTEPLMEKLVTRHDRVIAMKRALNEAKQVEAVAKAAMEAFRHRRDMLVQQGLIEREERRGDLSIGSRNAREDAQQHQRESTLERLAEIRNRNS